MKLYCWDLSLMSLLRCLVFCAAKHNFWFTAVHVPGHTNCLVDAIFRNRVDLFLSQAPLTMKKSPNSIIPEAIQRSVFRDQTGSVQPDEAVHHYYSEGLAVSTQKEYSLGQKHYFFLQFCSSYSIVEALPVNQDMLCYFVTYLSKRELGHWTIKSCTLFTVHSKSACQSSTESWKG